MVTKIMRRKLFTLIAVALAVAGAVTSCSDDDEAFVLRSDSSLKFSYSQEDKDFTVCTDGDWSITTGSDWLTFSTTSGKGDGTTREKIIVTAARNISEARTDSFILHAAGRDLTVVCQQEEGSPLTFGQAKLSGSLQAGMAADGTMVDVPYSYGYAGQTIKLHATLSGPGAEGLSIADREFTLTSAAGTLSLPLTGTPTTSGSLMIKIESDDATANTTVLSANILSKVLLEQHFDLMLWGSDIVNYKKGIKGSFVKDASGKYVIDETKTVAECSATADGSNDLILSMAESYRQLRGFSGWGGERIYEHPGYVKVGTGTKAGWIITPAIGSLTEGITTVKVTCRVNQYYSEKNGSLTIEVLNGGTPSVASYKYKYAGNNKNTVGTWEDVSFTISGAGSDTKVKFSTSGNLRFCIDDIVISEGK